MQSINELCEKGNSLSEVGMYQEALSCFKHALEITPKPMIMKMNASGSLLLSGIHYFSFNSIQMLWEYLRRAYFMIRETRL